MKIFWINITNNCNLNCVYCYQKLRNRKNMPIEVANNIISDIVKCQDDVSINFFGGEPFINYNVMKHIVNSISKLNKKNIWYSVTTNLTIFNEEMIDFIIKNNIYMAVSFDGTDKSFNETRFNKNNKINYFTVVENNLLKLKEKRYKNISIVKVISEHNYKYLYEDIVYLSKFNFSIYLNFDRDKESFNKNVNQKILEENIEKCFEFYLNEGNKKINLFSNLESEFKSLFFCEEDKIIENSCGILTCNNVNNMVYSFDVDGYVYPCHKMNEVYTENMKDYRSINIEELIKKLKNKEMLVPLNEDEKYEYINQRFNTKQCNKCDYSYFCALSDIIKIDSCCYFKRYEFRLDKKNRAELDERCFCEKKFIFDLFFNKICKGGYQLNDII